jgi:hypothetical protein
MLRLDLSSFWKLSFVNVDPIDVEDEERNGELRNLCMDVTMYEVRIHIP